MADHTYLDVTLVEYDPNNPRIASSLATYKKVTPEIIALALQPSEPKYRELRQAIITNEGIVNPIIVNESDGRYVAIEGNTRLAIYKQLNDERPDDERWQRIPAIVYRDMSLDTIDTIRLQAHLVGVRGWTPYARARYLYNLHNKEDLEFSALVDFCGGNQTQVQRYINAYREMEKYYRPIVPAEAFDTKKFSFFFEAQKPSFREALMQNGFSISDLANWVVEGRFEPRQNLIRKLPDILRTPRAHEEFFRTGAENAEKLIDRPEVVEELLSASLNDLCDAVQQKINDLTYPELVELRGSQDSIQSIEDAITDLTVLFEQELQK